MSGRSLDQLIDQWKADAIAALVSPSVVGATFLGWQPGFEELPPVALYNIVGGEHHGDTVSMEGLRTYGIAVPPTPPYEEGA